MTLIVGLICKSGAIMASDSQATTLSSGGPIKQTISKIKQLGPGKLWGASGTVGFIQDVENQMNTLPDEQRNMNLEQLTDFLTNIIFAVRQKNLNIQRGLYGVPEGNQRAPLGDFLFVEHKAGRPRILHLNPDCVKEWLDELGFGVSGIGDTFAYTILKKFSPEQLLQFSLDEGKIVAFRVLKEAIEVGGFGLGEPIEIWSIDNSGNITKCGPEEMDALRDTCRLWIEAEKALFRGLTPQIKKKLTPVLNR